MHRPSPTIAVGGDGSVHLTAKGKTMFDITTQFPADTAAIHLKGLDGEYLYDKNGNPVRIVVYGPGSKQFSVIEERQTSRALKRMQENDGKLTPPPAQQRAKEAAEDLAAITVAFENFDFPPAKGKPDIEKFEEFYAHPKSVHIRDQVAKAVKTEGNFKPDSAKD